MALFDDFKQMLNHYAAGAAPSGDTGAHFQQVAQSVDSGTLAQGIAAAMRSDDTPPFAQLVSQLFASASGEQKFAMLNTLLSSIPPDVRAQLSSVIPGLGAVTSGTAAQAISPDAVQQLAQRVEQHDAGIVEKMSALYAAHPMLVKALGSAAMMIAMRKIAERHQPVQRRRRSIHKISPMVTIGSATAAPMEREQRSRNVWTFLAPVSFGLESERNRRTSQLIVKTSRAFDRGC